MVSERRRLRLWQKIALGAVGVVIAAVLVIVVIYTQTNYGRERFRTLGLKQLAGSVHGIVTLGRVHGNLLSGATIEQVVITDSAGQPFLRADTLEMRYSLRSLFRKRIILQDVRLVHPVVMVDQPPGGKWNFQRLFPGDTTKNDSIHGFGDWLRIERLTVVRGDVTVRRSWSPPPGLAGRARDAMIAFALSTESRDNVVRVPGGFQALATFKQIEAFLPLVLWSDPDSTTRVLDVGRLSMIAAPYRPPVVQVRDLKGRVGVGRDTVVFDNLRVALPGSKLTVSGWYSMRTTNVNARVHSDSLQFADVRFVYPALPDGGGRLDLGIGRIRDLTRLVATNLDVRAEGAHVTGAIDVQKGPIQRINSSDLTFDGVDTKTIEKLAPVDVPIDAVLVGHLKVAGDVGGSNTSVRVDGWTNIHDRRGETSRITAAGGITNLPAGMFARNLALRFEPLRVSLLRTMRPDLPIGGVITGRAMLNGNLSDRFNIDADVIHNDVATGRSHLVAVGDLSARGEFRTRGLRMRFDPVQAALLRAFKPDLDLDGLITGRAMLVGGLVSGFNVDADVVLASPTTGRSHLLANGGLSTRNGFVARKLRLRFDPLQLALVRKFQPTLKLEGVLGGTATISGSMKSGFAIDADITHSDPRTGRSHILAVGDVLTVNGFVARNLKLRFDPLQVALVRQFSPTLPIDGLITGRATLNGSPKGRILATLDIAHEGSTGTSNVAGDAELVFAGELQRLDVNLRASPVSLATAGLFAPAAGLRGTASGTVIARGTRDNIQFTTDLNTPDGGGILARGTLALGTPLTYDIRSTLNSFDPAAISSRAPTGLLTGTLNASGRGTDPAAAVASIDAALVDLRLTGAPRLDSTRLVARVANGLATVERGHIRLASGIADIDGSFGLVASQSGTLNYKLTIDTLSRIADFATGDTAIVYPRPAVQARRMAQARADSLRIARETEVERAATGKPPEPSLVVDSVKAVPKDSVAGSLRAQGTLTGNIKVFDAVGTATLRDVLFRGSEVHSGDVAYKIRNAPSASMNASINASLVGVRTAGFGFDSARVIVDHSGGTKEGNGTFDLALFQDPNRDYRVKSDFVLALDRKELRLNDLLLRFDSTVWRGTQPGAVTWASSGFGLRTIDLRNERGGHVFADGTIPNEGSGDLRLDIDSLQIGDIAALLQDTFNTRGILSLNARIQGTRQSPLMAGTISLDSAIRGGIRLPELRGAFNYANTELTATAQVLAGAQQLLNADVKLPIDLALAGHEGRRILDRPLSIDAHMDSLPLDAMPSFTTAVQDVRGIVRGDLSVRGTFDNPELSGLANLTLGSMRIVEPNIVLTEGHASLRFKDRSVVVDSLVALSGGGPIRASGTVDLATLTRPGFNLQVASTDALLLNNHLGNIKGDAAIEIKGPYNAVRVTGTIAVNSGVINAPEQTKARRATNLDDPTLANVLDTLEAPLEFRRPRNPILANMQMDVRVTIARDTWVRNSTANVEIYTPDDADALHVRVDNAQRAITLEGTINADRGEYAVAGRQFKLTTGSITFLGTTDLDPLLQLSAQYEVPRRNREALTILINIGGYLRAPRLTLSSNAQPPLPQSDLISYLAFGRTSTSLLAQEGSGIGGGGLGLIAQQQIAALGLGAFTDALVRGFEDQGTAAGLDVFRIHPGTLPDELNFGGYFSNFLRGTQIEAGEYISKRFFVAVEGRATGTLPGLRLEYETPNGFSWRATWEPRFLPIVPSFAETVGPDAQARTPMQTRVLGTFFFWTRRF